MSVKKIFGLCLSLLLVAAMFSGCGASPSSNKPAAGSGKQQSEENTEATLSNEMEDSENMDSNSTAKNLVVYFSMPEAINTIKEMEPDADVVADGLSILRNVVQASEADIIEWLTEKGFVQ